MPPSQWHRLLRRFRFTSQRLLRTLTAAREIARRQRALVALTLVALIVAVHFLFVPPANRWSIFVDTTLTVLTTLAIAYVSLDYFVPYLQSSERNRIMVPSAVVEYYDSPASFITPAAIPDWDRQLPTDSIPVATEHVPDQPVPIDELQIEDTDSYYEFPPRLTALFEPRLDDLEALFFREGHFSTIQARLNRIDGGTLFMSRTSYFRSFVTNFCPDYELYKTRTLRDLTRNMLFEDDDHLRPLSESPLSDHLGVAGLVVTHEGGVLLSIRGRAVAIDKKTKALSFSGSVSHGIGGENVVRSSLLTELRQELGIEEEHVQAIQYLGTIRRMERLGKPDAVAILLVDEQATWQNASTESASVNRAELDTQSPIEEAGALFEESVAESILEVIAGELSNSPYRAEIGILAFVYLFALHSEITVSGAAD